MEGAGKVLETCIEVAERQATSRERRWRLAGRMGVWLGREQKSAKFSWR
jgi:hypothetical protein